MAPNPATYLSPYRYSSQFLTLEHLSLSLSLSPPILAALRGTTVSILQTRTFLQFKALENIDILIHFAFEFKVTPHTLTLDKWRHKSQLTLSHTQYTVQAEVLKQITSLTVLKDDLITHQAHRLTRMHTHTYTCAMNSKKNYFIQKIIKHTILFSF